MGLWHFAFLAAVTFVVTFALIPLVKKLAARVDAIDYPDARRMNLRPVPRLGGVAIYGGIIAGVLVEVCNFPDYRWIDRKFGSVGDYEYIRLYVKNPSDLSKGQFFVAITRPGEESSSPPGIGARWIFK